MKTNSIITIMTKNVVCITPEQYLIDVKHIYEKKKWHHHIPVTENEKLNSPHKITVNSEGVWFAS